MSKWQGIIKFWMRMSTRVELRIHYYSGWLGGWLDRWLVEIKTTLASVEVEVELSGG